MDKTCHMREGSSFDNDRVAICSRIAFGFHCAYVSWSFRALRILRRAVLRFTVQTMLFQQSAITTFCRIDGVDVNVSIGGCDQQTHYFLNGCEGANIADALERQVNGSKSSSLTEYICNLSW